MFYLCCELEYGHNAIYVVGFCSLLVPCMAD